MSIYQIGLVAEHVFSTPHRAIMTELAWFADDEGFKIRPALERVAYKSGYDVRHVRRLMRELQSSGVLVLVREATAQHPAVYRFDWSKAERKVPYHIWLEGQRAMRQARRSKNSGPVQEYGEIHEAGHSDAERSDIAMSADPSPDPSRSLERAAHDAHARGASTHTFSPSGESSSPPDTPFFSPDFAPPPGHAPAARSDAETGPVHAPNAQEDAQASVVHAPNVQGDANSRTVHAKTCKKMQKSARRRHRVVDENLTRFVAKCMGGLRFRLKTITRRDELASAVAAKRLYGKWTPEQIFEVYDALAAEDWRRSRITLSTVESEIGAYFYRKELREQRGAAHDEKRGTSGERNQASPTDRNYGSVYKRLTQSGGSG